ncbi:MAG: 4-hydroxy-tetrahydrodipicolinate reductase [Phycisphaerales bacterium]|nr:4-hydroxy-tetrahydrodipicolinate reductase [Phycisphaerales bacterium]
MSNQHATSIIVSGASGRMGARLCELALDDPRANLMGAVAHGASPSVGRVLHTGKNGHSASIVRDFPAQRADVVIDFSTDLGAQIAIAYAIKHRSALLVGTTGLSERTLSDLHDAAEKISVLVAPNTSLGVAALSDVAARLARTLGVDFRCSIVETHHIHKKDSPSGTALRLARVIRDGGGQLPENQVFSIRAGDVVGEHIIRFCGPGEVLELTHRATSRDLFARGAMRAALWLADRPAGVYTVEDALGLGPK